MITTATDRPRRPGIAVLAATTAFFGWMVVSTVMLLIGAPDIAAALELLRYPDYVAALLGTAKLAGLVVLLAPVPATLRQWAWAGFHLEFLMASSSYVASGELLSAAPPLVALGLAQVTYWSFPRTRAWSLSWVRRPGLTAAYDSSPTR